MAPRKRGAKKQAKGKKSASSMTDTKSSEESRAGPFRDGVEPVPISLFAKYIVAIHFGLMVTITGMRLLFFDKMNVKGEIQQGLLSLFATRIGLDAFADSESRPMILPPEIPMQGLVVAPLIGGIASDVFELIRGTAYSFKHRAFREVIFSSFLTYHCARETLEFRGSPGWLLVAAVCGVMTLLWLVGFFVRTHVTAEERDAEQRVAVVWLILPHFMATLMPALLALRSPSVYSQLMRIVGVGFGDDARTAESLYSSLGQNTNVIHSTSTLLFRVSAAANVAGALSAFFQSLFSKSSNAVRSFSLYELISSATVMRVAFEAWSMNKGQFYAAMMWTHGIFVPVYMVSYLVNTGSARRKAERTVNSAKRKKKTT